MGSACQQQKETRRTRRKAPTRTPTRIPIKAPIKTLPPAKAPTKAKERKLPRPKMKKMRRSRKKVTMTSHLALAILESTLGILATAVTKTENIYESLNQPAHLDFEVGTRA